MFVRTLSEYQCFQEFFPYNAARFTFRGFRLHHFRLNSLPTVADAALHVTYVSRTTRRLTVANFGPMEMVVSTWPDYSVHYVWISLNAAGAAQLSPIIEQIRFDLLHSAAVAVREQERH